MDQPSLRFDSHKLTEVTKLPGYDRNRTDVFNTTTNATTVLPTATLDG